MAGRLSLARRIELKRTLRVIGFDDARYPDRTPGSPVFLTGAVCKGTRFEGMLWGQTTKDGMTATDEIIRLVKGSKFGPQIHLILLDGLTVGGGNVVDLQRLSQELGVPAIAVMRRLPNLDLFQQVIQKLPEGDERWRRVEAAGPIHEIRGKVFQVCGEEPDDVANALETLTIEGKVPEALRLAHLIGSAVMTGESSNRA